MGPLEACGSFSVRAEEGNGALARNDKYETDEDTPLTIPAPGVLANDSNLPGVTLSAVLAVGARYGAVVLNPDGSFTYTPVQNYENTSAGSGGPDFFDYYANDGEFDSLNAGVEISVRAVNDKPKAADDFYAFVPGAVLDIPAPGVLANDKDPDNDVAELVAILVAPMPTGEGSLLGAGLNADGSFIYLPGAFTGCTTFSYLVQDPLATFSNTAKVWLGNCPYFDLHVPNVSVLEDGGPVTVTVELVNPGTAGATVDILTKDKATPEAIAGDDYVALALTTVLLDATTPTMDLTITLIDDAVAEGPERFRVALQNASAGTGILDSIGGTLHRPVTIDDPEDFRQLSIADAMVPEAVNGSTTVAKIRVSLAPPFPGGEVMFEYSTADGTATDGLDYTGTQTGVMTIAANAMWVDIMVPILDDNFQEGDETFTVSIHSAVASDPTGGTILIVMGDAVVTIKDDEVPPELGAVDDTYTTEEDTALVVGAPGVMDNDSVPDPSNTIALKITDPANGLLTEFNADGSFTYVPDDDFNGTNTFQYLLNDGTADSNLATVTIEVTAVNDAPVAVDDSDQVTLGETLIVDAASGVLANDTDVDGDVLTAVLEVDVPTGEGARALNAAGSFTYTPDTSFAGTETSFQYAASDGSLGSSAPVTLTLAAPEVPVPLVTGLNMISIPVEVAAGMSAWSL